MTTLKILGQPVLVLTFPFLPSWNTAIGKARAHWSKGKAHTDDLKDEGHTVCRSSLNKLFPGWRRPFFKPDERVLVVCKIWRRDDTTYDVHNLYTKALFDGFTSAGLWADDDWSSVPVVVYMFAGVDPQNPRVEIELHQLAYREVITDE